jgi:hypothetical protein
MRTSCALLRLCGAEDVLVQALVAKPRVEAFDEGGLSRLSGFDEVKLDVPVFCPPLHRSVSELGSVVDHDAHGKPVGLSRLVEAANHALGGHRAVSSAFSVTIFDSAHP